MGRPCPMNHYPYVGIYLISTYSEKSLCFIPVMFAAKSATFLPYKTEMQFLFRHIMTFLQNEGHLADGSDYTYLQNLF